ncbi:MAG: TetR/AcrR family transcriptional regulator [Solirubrobacteraceae bacterium]|nr:TetR/AcrR family transcriptional regulator [Solirubrobacteraceae bacterium]
MAIRTPTEPSARARRRHRMLLDISRSFEDDDPRARRPGELHLDELLEAAGIARSTFYVYFEDRADLLSALSELVLGELIEAARFWWALPDPVTRDDVREAMERIADAYRTHRGAVELAAGTAVESTRARDGFRANVGAVIASFAAGIDEGRRRGTIVDDVDPTAAATWLVWMLERGLARLLMPADAEETDRVLRSLTDLVWNILYRDAGSAR